MADPKVFISYRRSDSGGWTGRLCERLDKHFDHLFYDVEGIERGADFLRRIKEAIEQSDVMLVVMGPDWLTTTNRDGRRRLDDPDDVVRQEVLWALARERMRIVPLLIGGGRLPTKDDLPTPLQALALRNAMELRADRFEDDLRELVKQLGGKTRPFGLSRTAWTSAALAIAVAGALGTVLLLGEGSEGSVVSGLPTAQAPSSAVVVNSPPERPSRMTGDFNVAVAEFTSSGSSNDDGLVALSKQVHETLATAFAELAKSDYQVVVRPPEQTGRLAGETAGERASAALALANAVGADVVVHGSLSGGDPGTFVPEFYVAPGRVKEAEELVGHYTLGSPIDLKDGLHNMAVAKQVRQALLGRTTALAYVVAGLAYYGIRELEEAKSFFEKARQDDAWPPKDGKEVLYVLLGNVDGMQGDLAAADAMFTRALELAPEYARGLVGRAEVQYHRASGGCVRGKADAEGLREAALGFEQAGRAQTPPHAHIDVKVALGLGRVYRCLSQAGIEASWEKADQEFARVLAAPEEGLREYQALAHAERALLKAPSTSSAPGARESYQAAIAEIEAALALTRVDVRQEDLKGKLAYYERQMAAAPSDPAGPDGVSHRGDGVGVKDVPVALDSKQRREAGFAGARPGRARGCASADPLCNPLSDEARPRDNRNAFEPRDVPPPSDASTNLEVGFVGAGGIRMCARGADGSEPPARIVVHEAEVPLFGQLDARVCPGPNMWKSLSLVSPSGKRRRLDPDNPQFSPGIGDEAGEYRFVTETGESPGGEDVHFVVPEPQAPVVRRLSDGPVYAGTTLRFQLAGFTGELPPPLYLYREEGSEAKSSRLAFVNRVVAQIDRRGRGTVTLPLPKSVAPGSRYCLAPPGGCTSVVYRDGELELGSSEVFTVAERPPARASRPSPSALHGNDGSRYVVITPGTGTRAGPGDDIDLVSTYWTFAGGRHEGGGEPRGETLRVPEAGEVDAAYLDPMQTLALEMLAGESRRIWYPPPSGDSAGDWSMTEIHVLSIRRVVPDREREPAPPTEGASPGDLE